MNKLWISVMLLLSLGAFAKSSECDELKQQAKDAKKSCRGLKKQERKDCRSKAKEASKANLERP